MKVTPSLNRIASIATILSTVIAAASAIWAIRESLKPAPATLPIHSASVSNSGSRAFIVQGNGNTILAPQNSPTQMQDTERFIKIKIIDQTLDTQGNSRHEAHFPQISGKIPHDTLDRINHFLKRSALTEYERYAYIDEVRISYEIGLKEFNLLGVNFKIFANGDRAAHPITSTNATTLDLETGSPLLLKDLFVPGHIKKLNHLIRAALIDREQYYPCNEKLSTDVATKMVKSVLEDITDHPAKICFSSISDDSQYYLTDTALIFVFPKYSIAPGSDGDIEIPIYFKKIRDILKLNGPLQRFL